MNPYILRTNKTYPELEYMPFGPHAGKPLTEVYDLDRALFLHLGELDAWATLQYDFPDFWAWRQANLEKTSDFVCRMLHVQFEMRRLKREQVQHQEETERQDAQHLAKQQQQALKAQQAAEKAERYAEKGRLFAARRAAQATKLSVK